MLLLLAIWQLTEMSKSEEQFPSVYHTIDTERTFKQAIQSANLSSCYEWSFGGPVYFPLDCTKSLQNVR